MVAHIKKVPWLETHFNYNFFTTYIKFFNIENAYNNKDDNLLTTQHES